MWLKVVSSDENRSVSSERVRVPTRATTMAPADEPESTLGSRFASSRAYVMAMTWRVSNVERECPAARREG